MTKRKKFLICILSIIPVSIAAMFTGAYLMFREQLAAMGTIKKLDDRLYCMTYEGDYGFDDFLKRGGADSDDKVGEYLTEFLSHGFYSIEPDTQEHGCSTVQVKNSEDGYLFGRNYDWQDCTIMIVKTKPKDGYASISTCNMDYLGFGEGYLPEGFMNRMMAMASVYVPLDGMNEKGLCVADLMIDVDDATCQDTGKTNLTTTTAIRLLLDRAATVDEAVELLRQYYMHSSAGIMHHLAIADSNGRSVVAEYIDNQLTITETPVVTNFFLTDGAKYGIGSEQSKARFSILTEWLAKNQNANAAQMSDALHKVSQKNMGEEFEKTVWSIVYNQENGQICYCFRENFETDFNFAIGE